MAKDVRTRDDSGASDPGDAAPRAPAALVRIGHLARLHQDEAHLFILGDDREIVLGRGDPGATRDGAGAARFLADDEWMSAPHAAIVREGPAKRPVFRLVDRESRNGVFVGGRKLASHVLRHGDVITLGRTAFRFHGRPIADPDELARLSRTPFGPTRSVAPALLDELRVLARAAPSMLTVLVTGESGTGKEIAARELHARSGRTGPLVAVNCAALPESMVEAQLFGHRRGAFTGATEASVGLVAAANGGTLFLDEIGDMPLSAQAKLLRVLEQREVLPLGEVVAKKVDVRVVAATHADLRGAVETGRFRRDLLARLAQITVHLPRFAERREDLGPIVAHLAAETRATLSVEAARALLAYDFPLHVRELVSAIRSAALLAGEGRCIERAHLPPPLRAPSASGASDAEPEGDDDAGTCPTRAELETLLRKHRGNVTAAARAVGKGKMQLYRWLKRRGVDPEPYRG